MLEKDNGNTVEAICPSCKKRINVNQMEEVVFCKFCNKPFKVKEAINLFVEQAKRNKATQKPSNEAIAKFNAILIQDYKLAATYLEDIIKKEYPHECHRLLNCSIDFSNSYIRQNIENSLKTLYTLNPHIADMYYKILREEVNNYYRTKHQLSFSGEFVFFKLFWIDNNHHTFEKKIQDLAHMHTSDIYDGHDMYREGQNIKSYWIKFEDNIKKYHDMRNGYDDNFIDHVIEKLEKYIPHISASYGYVSYRGTCYLKEVVFDLDKRIYTLIKMLVDLYTPAKRLEINEKKRKQEEEARLKKEEARLKKEEAFWQQYIDLLKAGKAKKALALLERTKKPSETDEFTKFRKKLLGVKYFGDVTSLSAKTLAELSLEKNKFIL